MQCMEGFCGSSSFLSTCTCVVEDDGKDIKNLEESQSSSPQCRLLSRSSDYVIPLFTPPPPLINQLFSLKKNPRRSLTTNTKGNASYAVALLSTIEESLKEYLLGLLHYFKIWKGFPYKTLLESGGIFTFMVPAPNWMEASQVKRVISNFNWIRVHLHNFISP